MCLIFFAHDVHPDYRLILVSNRDEFYARPTMPAGFWESIPGVFGGRDLEQGGTWLGVTRKGRFATVTNYRDPEEFERKGRSRGLLLREFLHQESPLGEFTGELARGDRDADAAGERSDFNGYNLLVGDLSGNEGLFYYSNKSPQRAPRRLLPGIYGLSNHLLDSPWPKLVSGRTGFAELIRRNRGESAKAWSQHPDIFFDLMASSETAPDDALPDTGVGLERERFLSSRFIRSEVYGTRACSVMFVRHDGLLIFFERRFEAGGNPKGDSRYEFRLDPSA